MIRCCILANLPALLLCVASYGETRPAVTQPVFRESNPILKATLPPISVDMKDAPIGLVADVLGSETGTRCVAVKTSEQDLALDAERRYLYSQRWTLSVAKRPFWEVVEALGRQHPIGFVFPRRPDDSDLVLVPLHKDQTWVRAGDFMIGLAVAVRARPDDPLILHWTLISDPRLRIIHVTVPTLIMIDDRGEELVAHRADGYGGHLCPVNSVLSEPPTKLGTTIRSVKCEMLVSIDGAKEDVSIRFDCTDTAIPIRQ